MTNSVSSNRPEKYNIAAFFKQPKLYYNYPNKYC